ncbi:MAG: YafY family transcriptional regulator [Clostridiales bacterium]|nr:YafY family transcriptional regulator [Clostridiales bacterium]
MKLDRLVSIIVLLQRKEKVQAKELAEKFGVSVRTILRDIEAINLAGIPIISWQGSNGGIGIAEGYRIDKSVLTSDEMADMISTLKGFSGSMPDSRHEVLLEKFRNVLPASQLELLNARSNQLVIDLSPWSGNDRLKETLKTLRKAIEDRKILEFGYLDMSGARTNRTAEPCSLVLKGQNWYLYAWCVLRHDFRLFKAARMRDIVTLAESFEPRSVSLEKLEMDSDWMGRGKKIDLELLFDKEVANLVEAWFGEGSRQLEDGRTIVAYSAEENYQLYGFLLSFGPSLEVVSPPHIRKILAESAFEIFNKYSKDAKAT